MLTRHASSTKPSKCSLLSPAALATTLPAPPLSPPLGRARTPASKLAERERSRLREQGLAWLRADLALWEDQVEKGAEQPAAVQAALRHWQQDADLAGVREAAALEKLPEDQRKQWNKLWADVAALLKECGEEPKK
jgi:hypothetical protein